MLKRIVILFISLIMFFSVAVLVRALEENTYKLENATKSLYQSVKIKDYENSKQLIEDISELITTIDYKNLTTVEGMEAITSTVVRTKQSLAALEPNYDSILHYTTQLYLAVDALGHKEQPIWLRYYPLLQQDLESITTTIDNNNQNEMRVAIQNFQLHYSLLKPAIYVSKSPYLLEQIDSLIKALVNQKEGQDNELIIDNLNESIHQLFFGADHETFSKILSESIIWKASIVMGLIIIFSLSYVIWRKFKGTK